MRVTHSWRLCNAMGHEIDRYNRDDPLTAAVALERMYGGLKEWIAMMSRVEALGVVHPSQRSWDLYIHLEYVERGGDYPTIAEAKLRILLTQGRRSGIPAVDLLKYRLPDVQTLTRYIKDYLPPTRQVRALAD